MKKIILISIFAGLLSAHAHADWDAAGEAREAAARKAEQQRAAKKKAEHDKFIRAETAKVQREYLGKDATGKSDAEVERIYKQRQADVVRQAARVDSALGTSSRKGRKASPLTESEQADAAMKALHGKSIGDIGSMSPKERDAFFKEMEKKYVSDSCVPSGER